MPRFQKVDEIEPFRIGLAAGEIRYQHCNSCGRAIFYPRTFCPYCMALEDAIEWRSASGKGRLYTYSTIYSAPSEEFSGKTPYTLGYVEMDEGFYLYGEIEGTEDELEIGMEVQSSVEASNDVLGIRFRPVV
jgi:uncharacterized OB-fold protein